jgi:hypothetical protein
MSEARKTVFVSYARADRKWANELVTHIKPWLRDKRINLWEDSQLKPGDQWDSEIREALAQASVAVVLVSKHALASDYIAKHELPIIVERARQRNLRLIWIPISHAAVNATPLKDFQAASTPEEPFDSLKPSERDKRFTMIAEAIADAATIRTFAGGLDIVDKTVEPIQAALDKRPERTGHQFSVQAVYQPEHNAIAFSGSTSVITAADIATLPDQDRAFIADLEDSLERNYERWRDIRSRLGQGSASDDAKVNRDLARFTKLMCNDLNGILGFLRTMKKADLDDHYERFRYICSQLPAAR